MEQDLNETVDILEIDRKIRMSVAELIPRKQVLLNQIDLINELMQIESLRYNIRHDLMNIKNDLEEKISILHCWNFYTLTTIGILYKYLELINISITVDIFNHSAHIDEINRKKKILIRRFIRIIDFLLPQYKSLYVYNLYNSYTKNLICYNCNGCSFDKDDDIYICKKCYVETIYTTYDQVTQMTSQGPCFKDCIDQFQAKQNTVIDANLLTQLKQRVDRSATRTSVLNLLKELGYSRYYEDCHLIHHMLTGQKPHNISHLESQLLDDFAILSDMGKLDVPLMSILIQLLHKNGYDLSQDDISMVVYSESVQTIFDALGWSSLQ